MIVKLTFEDGLVMLFGNSYKRWHVQVEEYLWRKKIKPVKLESCADRWIGWGGLKWCDDEGFQHQLNREGTQHGEPDNPNPRQFKNMVFVENKFVKNKIKGMIK